VTTFYEYIKVGIFRLRLRLWFRFLHIKSENLSLTFSEIYSKELPSPPCLHAEVPRSGTQAWEGMMGRGDQIPTEYFLFTPTLNHVRFRASPAPYVVQGPHPPPSRGRDYSGNVKYFWLESRFDIYLYPQPEP
jgi:hypothetical protein